MTPEEREAEISARTRRINELTREIDRLQRIRDGERQCVFGLREMRKFQEVAK